MPARPEQLLETREDPADLAAIAADGSSALMPSDAGRQAVQRGSRRQMPACVPPDEVDEDDRVRRGNLLEQLAHRERVRGGAERRGRAERNDERPPARRRAAPRRAAAIAGARSSRAPT